MVRLLMYKASLRSMEAQLAQHGAVLTPVIVDDAGCFSIGGAAVPIDDVRPDAAKLDYDLFLSPAMPAFVAAVQNSPTLSWLHTGSTGIDHPLFVGLLAQGVRLTNSHGQAIAIAEYVLASVLDIFQRGADRRAAQSASEWRHFPFREVMGTNWLIVGFGAIGQAVAQRSRAFGATIVGIRRNQSQHPLADTISTLEHLTALAAEADVIVLSLPLTAATHKVADSRFFEATKPGAVLVNVGRGGLVDESALLEALDRGQVAHAVLDVFDKEPLAADSRFWTHPGVTVTAHTSAITDGQAKRNDALFLENLRRFLADEALLNEADRREVPGR